MFLPLCVSVGFTVPYICYVAGCGFCLSSFCSNCGELSEYNSRGVTRPPFKRRQLPFPLPSPHLLFPLLPSFPLPLLPSLLLEVGPLKSS